MPPRAAAPVVSKAVHTVSATERAAYASFVRDALAALPAYAAPAQALLPAAAAASESERSSESGGGWDAADDAALLGEGVVAGVLLAEAMLGAWCADEEGGEDRGEDRGDDADAAAEREALYAPLRAAFGAPGVPASALSAAAAAAAASSSSSASGGGADGAAVVAVHRAPRNRFEQLENHATVLALARHAGLHVVNIGGHDLLEAPQKPHLVMGLLWQIVKHALLRDVARRMRGLQGGLDDGGDGADAVPPEALLMLWFNSHLQAAGCERRVRNFAGDIADSVAYAALLHQLDAAAFSDADVAAVNDAAAAAAAGGSEGAAAAGGNDGEPASALVQAAEVVVQGATKMDCAKFVTAADIAGANPRLNLAFVATLFAKYPALATDQRAEQERAEEARRAALLEAEVGTLRAQVSELGDREADLAAEKAALRAELDAAAAEAEAAAAQAAADREAALEAAAAAAAAKEAEHDAAMAALRAELDQFRAQTESLGAEVSAQKDANSALEAKLADVQSQFDTMSAKAQELQETVAARDAALETAAADLATAKAEGDQLRGELAEANAARDATQAELDTARSDHAAELAQRDATIAGHLSTIQERDDEIARLKARIAELEAEVARLKAELEALRAEHTAACAARDAGTARVAELEAELDRVKAESAAALEKAELEKIEAVMQAEAERDNVAQRFSSLLAATQREGWLTKWSPAAMKGWQKRWFVLKGGQLLYYKDNKDTKRPAGVIVCGEVRPYPVAESDAPGKAKFAFDLVPNDDAKGKAKSARLCAASDDERKQWMQAIVKAKVEKVSAEAGAAQIGQ